MWAEITAQTFRNLVTLTLPSPTLPSQLRFVFPPLIVLLAGLAVGALPLQLATVFVSSAIFLVWGLIRPEITLYLLILIIPFSSLFAVTFGGVRIGGMELVLGFGLAAWLLRLLGRPLPSGTFTIEGGPLFLAFGLFLASISLSYLVALSLGAAVVETAKWIEMAVLYLFVINLLPWRQLPWVAATIILAGVAQAVLGLYQFIFKVGPEGFLLFGGRFLRAFGTFAQPNPYGGYLGLVLPLVLSLAVWALTVVVAWPLSTGPLGQWLKKLVTLGLLGAALGVMVAALYASQSRGAWVGFAVASLGMLMVRSRRVTVAFAAIGLIGVIVLLMGSFSANFRLAGSTDIETPYNAIFQRFADAIDVLNVTDVANTPVTDANFATLERLAHWQAAKDMWRDHPWLGVGFGNYAVVYPAYAVGRWLEPLGHAHNYLLNIGAEAGLVGVMAYLIFWIFVFGLLWYTVQLSFGFEKAVACGIVGIIIHLHVHNLVDNLYVQGMYLHIAIMLGLASVIYQRRKLETLK